MNTDDLVKRLRSLKFARTPYGDPRLVSATSETVTSAAARIEQLEAELTRANAATAAAYDVAAKLINRIANGYASGGDCAIACGLYLTEGNIRALATPDQTAALDKLIAGAEARGMKRAMQAVDALPEAQSPDVNVGVANAYAAILALIGEKK